uniref:Uncharacterized protein n=1 Tax=viral metagenome TaxID=1070528 RepID=A0A6C0EET1_9ZZZZ
MSTDSIFVKLSELPKEEFRLTKEYLEGTIPDNCVNEEDKNLASIATEWRWRFFKIGEKSVVEISKKKCNEEREYLNKYGQWVKSDIGNKYDNYITKVLYNYTF